MGLAARAREFRHMRLVLGGPRKAFISLPILCKIMATAFGMGLVIFSTQEGVSWQSLWKAPSLEAPSVLYNISTVDLADVLRLYHGRTAVILDVRDKKFYDYGHIEGAISAPIETLHELPAPVLQRLRDSSSVLVYCNNTSCGIAFAAARILIDQGLDHTVVYPEGWSEWRSCKLPMTMSQEMKKEEDRITERESPVR